MHEGREVNRLSRLCVRMRVRPMSVLVRIVSTATVEGADIVFACLFVRSAARHSIAKAYHHSKRGHCPLRPFRAPAALYPDANLQHYHVPRWHHIWYHQSCYACY